MNWFQKLMYGRYGTDQLNLFLLGIYLLLAILSWLPFCRFLLWLAMIPLVLTLLRMFSKDREKRYAENAAFMRFWESLTPFFNRFGKKAKRYENQWKDRKTHCYFSCPNCKQNLRVPKGRGKIKINCPKCHTEFIRKT